MRFSTSFAALFLVVALIAAPNYLFAATELPEAVVKAAAAGSSARPQPPAPAFPGTNGRIVFGRFDGGEDGPHDIFSITADGGNERRLTNNGAYNDQPRYSADGTKIVFMSNRDDNFEIYSMNANGTNQTRLTNNFPADGFPTWSPDGSKIAFVRGDLRNPLTFEIYSMDADGSNQVRLTNNSEIEGVPAWSPDGTRIAFMSSAGSIFSPNAFEIYVMNANGSNRTRLTNDSVADAQPAWSPDGARLAFASGDAANPDSLEIYVMNASNGGNRMRLTTNNVTDGFPAWSPDGARISFASGSISSGGENTELFVMDASNGNNRTALTNNSRLDWFPDWGVAAAAPVANPIDDTEFFVRQHYSDFLFRTADANGLAFWVNNIESCGADAQCREVKRIDTSAAFFLSIEFQQTGYFVHRSYKAAFGNIPGKPVPLTFDEFISATRLFAGVSSRAQGSEQQQLEANKQLIIFSLTLGTRFMALYPESTPPADLVDALNANAGNPLTQQQRDALVAQLTANPNARPLVLSSIVNNAEFVRSEFNRAFVLTQYFGYLRRNPDDAPDGNFDGYNFWLAKLNQFNGDFRAAEMVKAFINSEEYRRRFAF